MNDLLQLASMHKVDLIDGDNYILFCPPGSSGVLWGMKGHEGVIDEGMLKLTCLNKKLSHTRRSVAYCNTPDR